MVKESPDNAHISRVPDAGILRDGLLTMHNGLRVSALGYYGSGIMNMLLENRGVHEPQEERVFAEVLPLVRPGGNILELGAYWGFYSMWFVSVVSEGRCFLIEPDYANLSSGRMNLARVTRAATFEQAYVGSAVGRARNGTPIVTVDDFCERHAIRALAVLHADIQGAELDMLFGAERMISDGRVEFCFISSHSNDLHYACIDFLVRHGYQVVASADLDESYSEDGLIVAGLASRTGGLEVPISRRPKPQLPLTPTQQSGA